MTRRRASIRAAAIRRAQEAKAQRDAERLGRERQIEAALADYFEATGRAAAIRAEARRKADKALADGEAAAGTPETASRDAVFRLRALTGSHAEAAGLCGLTVTAMRAMLRPKAAGPAGEPQPEPGSPPGQAGHPASPDPAEAGR